jgi:CHAT domain-containing protein
MMRLFPGGQQKLGAQASRKQLNQLQASGKLKQYRILHFATHGYVDDARSALVLSMLDGPDQGYLQDTDVLDLQLNTDLVLLSACDTGIGRNVSGEGVMGLPYAFMLAGNSNTLMSLWPVDDTGTAAFMSTFMTKARSGADLFTALNQTKREFAGGKHGNAFTDPRIWAAFVQYGIGITLRQ